jgi:phosphoribosylaminoimidazole-succinocarboxamide synthase
MIGTLYRGSVKDIRGPVKVGGKASVVFDYTDAYSVFDWGRMPDLLTGKGQALAIIAAEWFERFASAEFWREFSKSGDALELRKGNRFGSGFNEVGEELQKNGLRTHYQGALAALPASEGEEIRPQAISAMSAPFSRLAVRQVSVTRPVEAVLLGRSVPDYLGTRQSPAPRLIPLEVVFRFGVPAGSSLLERVARDPGYLASIGFGEWKIEGGAHWPFPILELFTKLESTDRSLTLPEALAISGISGALLQEMLFKTAWISGAIKSFCARAGLELADGKLEWAIDEDGKLLLVDAIGPDELRLLKGPVQLSKEFLRAHYRKTAWYETVVRAKNVASHQGIAEWKKLVAEGPPLLPPQTRELGSQLYLALANALTGRAWFSGAWTLERVIAELRAIP